MTRRMTDKYLLPLAAALLAAPLAVGAQQAPPAPTAPPAPGGPNPPPTGPGPAPTNPPAPTTPTGPPPPVGGGGGGTSPLAPPPPPPTPPAPNAAPAPGGTPGGVFVPTPALPLPPDQPQNALPDATQHPDIGNPGTRLRYKFQAGQTLSYHVVVDLNGNIEMGTGGTKAPLKQHLEMTLDQTTKSVDANGAATISEKVSAFTATVNGQAIPLPPQAQQQMQQPFTVVMSPTGQVQSIKLPTGAAAMPPTGFDPSQFSQIQALPTASVNIGDKWRSDYTAAVAGVETHVAYTLSGLSTDGGTATIGQKIYAAFKPAKAGAGAPSGVKLDGTLTGTGTQQFDIAAGQIASQTNNMTLDLTVTPSAGAQPVKTHFDITATLQRQGAGAGATAAAPTGEPPTGQLQ